MATTRIPRRVTVSAIVAMLAIGQFACVQAGAAKPKSVQKKTGRLKVFILAGQSNMEGHGVIKGRPGQKGTLETLTKDSATAARYKHLLDKDGKWIVRDDVLLSYYDAKSKLTIGKSAAKNSIGPELAFGWVVGDYIDDKVLLIKRAPGGCSLAGPWRPPSSGPAGKKPRGPGVGDQYDGMIADVKKALKNLKTDFPDYDGKGYEIVGFGWHQGWNDGCSANDVAQYEKNMVNFIRDVRKDLGVPKLPFVIGGSGFGGWGQTVSRRLGVMKAQTAAANRPEFKGNVQYVETRSFFRDGPVSPRPIRYHWCCNAESYYLIGEGMGRAMVELLGGPKAPPNPTGPENTGAGKAGPAGFVDSFDGKLDGGWSWLREDKKKWRIKDGGLEICVQPGVSHNVKNALLRKALDPAKGAYTVEVTVTSHTVPTNQFEQAGIMWYHNGKPVIKLVKELVRGKLVIIPGVKPMTAKTVQLRLVVSKAGWTAQYRPDAKGEFLTAGKGRIPAGGKHQISIQCYNGPPNAEHWIRFDDFRITPIKK
ncbi:MAG: sialate O-acetylesterase [Phycisphaerae bacterium]|nr:sialate O-acetylesterase [Phycisphaerae bacterium]